MPLFANISCYCFAELQNLKTLRQELLKSCKERELKGTILLSTEGVNLFLAGPRDRIDEVVTMIRAVPGLEKLAPKYSESDHQPFNRMLVRIKKEIISFGVEGVNPARRTSPKLGAKQLKQWLDEGKPITLLDTRNDYEIKLGTFRGALPAGIKTFREFPEAVRKLPVEMKDQPIVMFCTGGIRCEKAGPFMEMEGYREIYQLDGGILKYFEEVGGDHYDGECFVFDQRVGVDPALQESETTQCFACLAPLTKEDQEDPRYIPPHSCPYCYKSPEFVMSERVAARKQTLQEAIRVLPGSIPYENRRPLLIPQEMSGMTLLDALEKIFHHQSREEWKKLCEEGRFQNSFHQVLSSESSVRGGERIAHVQPGWIEPEVSREIEFIHEDEAIVVLSKPAPLPVHACGRFQRNTLDYFLDQIYPMQKVRAAHRLDANTTGIMVWTRARRFASILQPQFARGEVEKTYLVQVHGHPVQDQFSVTLSISEDPREAGTREVDIAGLPAQTDFEVLERRPDGTAFLIAHPRTGRTNQIRVHLWEIGHAIVGDSIYLPHRQLGTVQTQEITAEPLRLHAWKIAFQHPMTKARVEFESPKPPWVITY